MDSQLNTAHWTILSRITAYLFSDVNLPSHDLGEVPDQNNSVKLAIRALGQPHYPPDDGWGTGAPNPPAEERKKPMPENEGARRLYGSGAESRPVSPARTCRTRTPAFRRESK